MMKTSNGVKKIIASVLIVSILFCIFCLPIAADTKEYLEYNQVLDENGNWVVDGGYYNLNWENYNCYAFAINRIEKPKFYLSNNMYVPGDIKVISGDNDDNIYTQVAYVVEDLSALGYTNISLFSYIPSVNEAEELICIRCDSEGRFHFMAYDYETNAWYHKPGNTAVLKYTDNGGIPSEDVVWYSEMSHNGIEYSDIFVYDSEIVFIKYSKLQLNALWNDILVENITVKPQKDVIYEITVDESDLYDITLSSQSGSRAFNYEIYSYNKFTGDYNVIESGSSPNGGAVTESVYLTKFNEYDEDIQGWELQAYKHYIRLDYGKEGSTTNLMNVIIEHSHTHNHHYSYYSQSQHKAYCECSMYELQAHNFNQFSNITSTHHTTLCICGAVGETKPHYEAYGEYYTKDWHYVYCDCGYLIRTDTHSMVPGWKLGTSRCTVCGYIRNNSGLIEVIKGIEDEAETE